MRIEQISSERKRFLDLLLLADEHEDMIDRYIERGDLFALYDDDLKSVCVVTREDDGVYEIKNLATYERYHGRGYGRALIGHVLRHYEGRCRTMLVGTGENAKILSFYESCGFTLSHKIAGFFVDNYDHPMFEDGVRLVDMIYLKRDFEPDSR